MDSNTIRIFSFPGGGSKGYGSNRFMQKFLQQWGIPQGDLWKYADVICGTSIGGILASAYAYGKTPDEMESFFLDKAKRIFTIRTPAEVIALSHNAGTDSNRPNLAEKLILMGLSDDFYKSPFPDSDFGSNILNEVLVENFGTDTLAALKTYVVIPSMEKDLSRYVVFSNFADPIYFKGETETIVNVCRATSAAPIYLPQHSFNEHDYIDGGVYMNDPVLAAINLARTIKPNATRICIVDVGTGIGNMSFDGSGPLPTNSPELLFNLMNVAMTGAEQGVKRYCEYIASRLPEEFFFYSFQPPFPLEFANELDNSAAAWFAELAGLVDTHYTNESAKIATILGHLTA